MSPLTTGRTQSSYPGTPRTRRAVLQLGLASAVALVVNACGGNSTKSAAAPGSSAAPAAGAGSTAATAAASAAPTTVATAKATAAAGPPIPTGTKLAIDYTFTPSAGGRGPARNPYMAVWMENAGGIVVRTVFLSLQQGKGERWWNELRRWFNQDQARQAAGGTDLIPTISTPTRAAGAVNVVWDGLDDAGAPAALGDYFVCIEAAREHGPYQLIREKITLGKEAFQKPLTPNGDLTSAALDYKPV